MKIVGKICSVLLLVQLCVLGVRAAPENHIVQKVEVSCRSENEQITRQYTDFSKMEAVLNFLRLTEYAGMPDDDPDLHTGSRCKITVLLAGGDRHIYYLLADRYLSRNYQPWEQVVPPGSLLALVQELPADQ